MKQIVPFKPTESFTADHLGQCLAGAVAAAQKGKQSHAVEAIRAGTLALIAKEVVSHGQFMGWASKLCTVHNLEHNALNRYMRVAVRFWEANTGAKLLSSAFLEFGGDLEDGFRKLIVSWLDGRSLSEIYRDCQITKKELPPAQHHPPKPLTIEEQAAMQTELQLGLWTEVNRQLVTLSDVKQWELLPKENRRDVIYATLPVVKNFALNTAWTASERKILIQNLRDLLITVEGAE